MTQEVYLKSGQFARVVEEFPGSNFICIRMEDSRTDSWVHVSQIRKNKGGNLWQNSPQ